MNMDGRNPYEAQFELRRQEGVYENLATILLLILFPSLCLIAFIVGIGIAVEEDELIGIMLMISSILSAGFSVLGAFVVKYIVKLSKRVRDLDARTSLQPSADATQQPIENLDINTVIHQTETSLESLLEVDYNGSLGVQTLAAEFYDLKQQVLAQPDMVDKDLESKVRNLHAQVIHLNNRFNTGCNKYQRTSPGMSFGDTFVYFFNHYADFTGRARRQEFWFMYLWTLIFGLIPFVNIAWGLATFVPSLALSVRRLHDIGKSGVYLLFYLIPLAGPIIMIVFFATDSDRFTNLYGPSPKYR